MPALPCSLPVRSLSRSKRLGQPSSDNDTLPRQGRRMFSRLSADGGTYLRRPRRYFKAFGIPSNLLIGTPSSVPSPHACRGKEDQREDRDEQAEQTLDAARVHGVGSGRRVGTPPYRQRGCQKCERMVGPRLHPRGG